MIPIQIIAPKPGLLHIVQCTVRPGVVFQLTDLFPLRLCNTIHNYTSRLPSVGLSRL